MKAKILGSASVVGLMIIGSFVLAGCTVNIDGAPDTRQNQSESAFSATELMFAQMMIPHHQQAIQMSQLAESRTENVEVLELADQIEAAQQPEIEQMSAWLGRKSVDADADAGMMNHDMSAHGGAGMGGMVSEKDMLALESASGAEFDRLYLTAMIAHHEGAIQMTSMVSSSKNSEVLALARSIVSSQTDEIALMKSLLATK